MWHEISTFFSPPPIWILESKVCLWHTRTPRLPTLLGNLDPPKYVIFKMLKITGSWNFVSIGVKIQDKRFVEQFFEILIFSRKGLVVFLHSTPYKGHHWQYQFEKDVLVTWSSILHAWKLKIDARLWGCIKFLNSSSDLKIFLSTNKFQSYSTILRRRWELG